MQSIGQRVREIRVKKGLSANDVSKKTGMTADAILKLERDERGKTLEKLPAIAKVLGCRIDDLFPEMDNELDELEM